MIKRWWNEEEQSGWKGYEFMIRLKSLKGKLKVWRKEVFGDVEMSNDGKEGLNNLLRKKRDGLLHKVGDLAQKENKMETKGQS